MIKAFEDVMDQTTARLKCSEDEKREIELELADHLYSAHEYYVEKGLTQEEAIQQVLADFGQTDMVSEQFQQAVSPLYGWLKRVAWIGFMLYSFAVLWKLLIQRLIIRVEEYIEADGPQQLQYVYSNPLAWESKQFFDFSQWQSNLNMQPLEMVIFYAKAEAVNLDIALQNLLGNIVLLWPLGFLLPFLFYRCKSLVTVVAIACCTSLAIEVVQFCLQIGMADIDDVLLNTLGAALGYAMARSVFSLLSWRVKVPSCLRLK